MIIDFKQCGKTQLHKSLKKRHRNWLDPLFTERSARMYQYMTPTGDSKYDKSICGCPVQIYHDNFQAALPEITDMIKTWPIRLPNPRLREPITAQAVRELVKIQEQAGEMFRAAGLR